MINFLIIESNKLLTLF